MFPASHGSPASSVGAAIDDPAAPHPLADVVVGLAGQAQLDAVRQERTERLPRRPVEARTDGPGRAAPCRTSCRSLRPVGRRRRDRRSRWGARAPRARRRGSPARPCRTDGRRAPTRGGRWHPWRWSGARRAAGGAAARRRGGHRRASTSRARSRSARPMTSSSDRKPRTRAARAPPARRSRMNVSTTSGVPANFARRLGPLRRDPDRAGVADGTSAPSAALGEQRGACRTSTRRRRAARRPRRRGPVFRPPSTRRRTRDRRPFSASVVLRLGQPQLPREPGVLDRRERATRPVPPSAPEMCTTSAQRLRDARPRPCRRLSSATSFTETAAPRVHLLQVVDELREILDGVDVVVRRRRDQRRRPAACAAAARSRPSPCDPAAGRPRPASSPARS